MTTEKRATIRLERRFQATPRRVFEAWTDPGKVEKWIASATSGEETVRIDLKARVGKAFTLLVQRGDELVSHSGEFLEVVPGRRLVFTWVVSVISKETTLVSVDLNPVPSIYGGTDLLLTHERILPTEMSRTAAKWNDILGSIAALVHS